MKSAGNAVISTLPTHWSHDLQHLRHKRLTFAFVGESGYTLSFAQRIAHSGLHGETGAFPPSASCVALCRQRNCSECRICTPDSAVLLYTYISRFTVNSHHQQMRKIRQSCRINFIPQPFLMAFFNFSHKRPTFAFTPKSGYTHSALLKESHTAAHAAKQGAFRAGVLSLLSARTARSQTSLGRVSERQTLPLLGLGRVCSRRTQKAFGTAMRLCVSLFRGVAAPLGCVIFSVSVEIAACMPCAQGLSVCARRGVVSLPSARFTCC